MTEKYEVQVLQSTVSSCARGYPGDSGAGASGISGHGDRFFDPKWLEILPNSHWLKSEVIQAVRGMMDRTVHMRDVALGAAGGNRGSDPPDPDCINENG